MFDSKKTEQLIGCLLSKAEGTMNYTKLLKLMYIIDRQSLKKRGFPITYDSYVSMDNGPVLSLTYDLIKRTDKKKSVSGYLWAQNLRRTSTDTFSVSWIGEVNTGKLSRSDMILINHVWDEFGDQNYSQLIDYVHKYKEWEDPNGSSNPISYETLLQELGYDNKEATLIANEITQMSNVEDMLAAHTI